MELCIINPDAFGYNGINMSVKEHLGVMKNPRSFTLVTL